MNSTLTADELRSLVGYDPTTGLLQRLSRRVGTPYMENGYIRIRIDGRAYRAHRLAWLHFHGEWPSEQIDHINGFRSDNRIENLRQVSNAINGQNRKGPKSNNKSGYLGVHWNKKDRAYRAVIKANRVTHYLGSFQDPATAYQAYLAAKRVLHPGCTI